MLVIWGKLYRINIPINYSYNWVLKLIYFYDRRLFNFEDLVWLLRSFLGLVFSAIFITDIMPSSKQRVRINKTGEIRRYPKNIGDPVSISSNK